ncbi:MAG: tripartite tricarboxylate transporter TctB family protein [Hyphomicrobiales bacterium]
MTNGPTNAGRAWLGFVFWAGLAVTGFLLTFTFEGQIANYRYGPGMWPRALFAAMLAAAAIQLYFSLRSRKSQGDPATDESLDAIAVAGLPLRIVAVPVVYMIVLPWIGFFAATPLFLAGVMLAMGERRPGRILAVTALIFALIVLVFIKLLYVPLPIGNWPGFYDFGNWFISVVR